jgi:hypothetical protein
MIFAAIMILETNDRDAKPRRTGYMGIIGYACPANSTVNC